MIEYRMKFAYTSNLSGFARGRRAAGWSEGFYRDGSTPDFQKMLELCSARAKLMPEGVDIIGQSYHAIVEQVAMGKLETRGPSTSGSNFFPGNSGIKGFKADVPTMAIQVDNQTAGGNVRKINLRGLPDLRAEEGEYLESETFKRFLKGLTDALVGWKMRAIDQLAPTQTIASIDGAGNFVLDDNLLFAEGLWVHVLRSVSEEGNRRGGFFKIETFTDQKHGKLRDWPWGTTTRGRMRLFKIIYPALVTGMFSEPRLRARKVGRPTDVYHGKA